MSTPLRLFLLAGLTCSTSLYAQVTTPTTPVVRKGSAPRREAPQSTPKISERAKAFADHSDLEDEEYTAWSRTYFRLLERREKANAPLFYPEVTTEREGNLFSLIFRLYAEGKIRVHSYQDGLSSWRGAEALAFTDFLDRFHIAYTKDQQGRPEVALADIPSALIEGYYLEEESRFDERTSTFSTHTRALCPLLTGVGDYGQLRMPLFWVSFDELRPYLSQERIALSTANGARRSTLADFFALQVYRGSILPTSSSLDQNLDDKTTSLERQQARSQQEERELQQFQANLFVPDSILHPTLPLKSSKGRVKQITPKASSSRSMGRDRRIRPATTTSPKSTSSATRSVRNRG